MFQDLIFLKYNSDSALAALSCAKFVKERFGKTFRSPDGIVAKHRRIHSYNGPIDYIYYAFLIERILDPEIVLYIECHSRNQIFIIDNSAARESYKSADSLFEQDIAVSPMNAHDFQFKIYRLIGVYREDDQHKL